MAKGNREKTDELSPVALEATLTTIPTYGLAIATAHQRFEFIIGNQRAAETIYNDLNEAIDDGLDRLQFRAMVGPVTIKPLEVIAFWVTRLE